ncbi:hypothetical protein CYLTODRAFT_489835 [Cylindrobasidium torrendii FP15055 ss-10]|uniref:F-box domain-containing protein n=1 Tax=Cylindrobasidium torrendii FP15055 ss-10 TaxID=1314674 RepID=A0A0D7BCW9_9AGAR|nr:hypothetical protein CYLTODRAFT_489835 [Cylindrobasidium torrendii FP15055 ss-10]
MSSKDTSMVSIASCLPIELLDKIFNNVNEISFDDIHAVSLVSHLWRGPALRYLFAKADFGTRNDFERWNAIGASQIGPLALGMVRHVEFAPGERQKWRALRALRERFGDETAWKRFMATYANVLNVTGSSVEMTLPPHDSTPLPPMPFVRTLSWNLLKADKRSSLGFTPATARFLSCFPRVTELNVDDIIHANDLRMMLSAFPCLRSLTWIGGVLEEDRKHIVPFTGDLSHLEVLDLTVLTPEFGDHADLDWLLEDILRRGPPPLRRISFAQHGVPFSVTGFTRLLSSASHTLQELSFEPASSFDPEWQTLPATVSQVTLPALRTFSILNMGAVADEPDLSELQWAAACLPDAPFLEEIQLHFRIRGRPTDIFNEDFIDWVAFSSRIRSYSSLRSLTLVMYRLPRLKDSEKECTMACARERLVSLADRVKFVWA